MQENLLLGNTASVIHTFFKHCTVEDHVIRRTWVPGTVGTSTGVQNEVDVSPEDFQVEDPLRLDCRHHTISFRAQQKLHEDILDTPTL